MTPGPRRKQAKNISDSPEVGSNPFARAIEVSNKKLVTIKRESTEYQSLRREGTQGAPAIGDMVNIFQMEL